MTCDDTPNDEQHGELRDGCPALEIDLDAIAANWRLLREKHARKHCAAVIKADGYGLGAARIAPVLQDAGCREFFVAHAEEGAALRPVLGDGARIFILNGFNAAARDIYAESSLIPVLNTIAEIADFIACGGRDCIVHFDTGMTRLGLDPAQTDALLARKDWLGRLNILYWMSHLACADTPDHPLNAKQLGTFRSLLTRLPDAPATLANSSGIFLGPDYHFDLLRPGYALYGGNPVPGQDNPMRRVVDLQARVLQIHDIDTAKTVGYGATRGVSGGQRIATAAIGYADGYMRSLSNAGYGYFKGNILPVTGRISMDLTTFDVTDLPEGAIVPGDRIELIGAHVSVDQVAAAAGTIGYEILTRLGKRCHRIYRQG